MRLVLTLAAGAFCAGLVLGVLVPPPIEVALASVAAMVCLGIAAWVIWRA